jgi:superfamily II DNA or RNA helicase
MEYVTELRLHQQQCKDNLSKFFETEYESKCLVKMFCGSGKSFVIYDTILAHGKDLSVVVVPSIHLITQFKRDYLIDDEKMQYNEKYYEKYFDICTICSLDELHDSKDTFTTDEETITDFLFTEDIEKVVLVTYQSLPKFIKIIQENEISVHLICFDEAHHILGMKMKHLLFGYDDSEFEETWGEDSNESESYENFNFLDEFVKKTVFFTATPKNTNGIVMYEVPEIEGSELFNTKFINIDKNL